MTMDPSQKSWNILLVDDHPLLLEGLARMINTESGLGVCGTADNAEDALGQVKSRCPDLVVTDLTMPGRNGLEFIRDLSVMHPDIPVIVLSMHDEMIYAERVLRAGGKGYVMKDSPPSRLIQAIRTVLGGGIFASQKVADHLLKVLATHKTSSRPSGPLECLTDREMEVYELIGRAKSNHEIAAQLNISPRTVDAHRAHIRDKLGLTDSNELTRNAIRWAEVRALET